MSVSKDLLEWVCKQVKELEERPAEVRALHERMARAGMATADMEPRLRQLAEQLGSTQRGGHRIREYGFRLGPQMAIILLEADGDHLELEYFATSAYDSQVRVIEGVP